MILPSASKYARLMRLNLTLTIRKNNRHYSATEKQRAPALFHNGAAARCLL
jgi:hypothetical protein